MKRLIYLAFLILWAATPGAICLGQPQEPDFPNYSNRPRADVPEIYRWRLEELFESTKDWRQALDDAKERLDGLAARIQTWDGTAGRLAEYLETLEDLDKRSGRLIAYASLGCQVSWSDPVLQDMNSQAERLAAELSGHRARLVKHILDVDRPRLAGLIASEPRLGPFGHYLQELVRDSDHRLSPELERSLAEMRLFSQGPRAAADALRNLDMPAGKALLPDGREMALDGAAFRKLAGSPAAAERRAALEGRARNLKRYENTFAALLDMKVKHESFDARSRRFDDSLSAELFPYEVPTSVYRNLIETIKGQLGPYHSFQALRKRLLGLEELHPYDDYLPLVPDQPLRFSYAEACRLLRTATAPLGEEYRGLVDRAFADRWVDVYGHQDKVNIGSAQSFPGVHPFVSLDYRGSFFDMITVAHELGHALSFDIPGQAQLSSSAQINWFVSEAPSTFNEILVMRRLIQESRDDRMKLALYAELIQRLNLLLFDSARMAEMQWAMHEHVDNGGTLTPAWLNAKQLELERIYRGHTEGVMAVDDFVETQWNHPNTFFAPFQGYFYVVGAVVSLALVDEIERNGAAAAQKYMDFLRAGGSRPIMDVLREMGLDLGTPEPIVRALRVVARLVDEMAALANANAR